MINREVVTQKSLFKQAEAFEQHREDLYANIVEVYGKSPNDEVVFHTWNENTLYVEISHYNVEDDMEEFIIREIKP